MPIKTKIGLRTLYINLNTDSTYEYLLALKLKLRRAKDIQYN